MELAPFLPNGVVSLNRSVSPSRMISSRLQSKVFVVVVVVAVVVVAVAATVVVVVEYYCFFNK